MEGWPRFRSVEGWSHFRGEALACPDRRGGLGSGVKSCMYVVPFGTQSVLREVISFQGVRIETVLPIVEPVGCCMETSGTV